MTDNRVLNVILLNRRDTIRTWENSPVKIKYGELALGYGEDSGSGDGMLYEIRAGHKDGILTWSELTTYVPVFPVRNKNIRKNTILGYDENGMPAFFPKTSGVLAVVSGSEGIAVEQLDESTFSVGIDTNSDYIGFDSNNGLDIVRTEVTYTPVSGETPASLTATGTGLVDNSAISQIKSYVDAKNGEAAVTVEKLATAETGYVSSYVVKQNNVQVGATINIPKDFLVKSATLKTVTVADQPYAGAKVGDKYIDFVVNTKDSSAGADESHIYLPVNDLVDAYTGNYNQSQGQGLTTAVTIEVDDNNQISAHTYTQTVADATAQQNGLATALDVKTYVDNATPNIAAGDGINVTTSGTTKTVEVKLGTTPALGFDSGDGLEVVLDETTQTAGLTQSSGLQKTANGLRIDDTLTWVFQCGGALNVIE